MLEESADRGGPARAEPAPEAPALEAPPAPDAPANETDTLDEVARDCRST